jgi:ribosomal-protein-alanine N-acetyltransferase
VADLPALGALERITFTDPWSPGDFAECRAAGMTLLVAEQGADLVGYVVGRSVLDEAEILNVGVAGPARRHGVARALVQALLAAFAGSGVCSVFLEVRESNRAARALYQSFSFREVGRRPRYYRRPVEDAVVLRARLEPDSASA